MEIDKKSTLLTFKPGGDRNIEINIDPQGGYITVRLIRQISECNGKSIMDMKPREREVSFVRLAEAGVLLTIDPVND